MTDVIVSQTEKQETAGVSANTKFETFGLYRSNMDQPHPGFTVKSLIFMGHFVGKQNPRN